MVVVEEDLDKVFGGEWEKYEATAVSRATKISRCVGSVWLLLPKGDGRRLLMSPLANYTGQCCVVRQLTGQNYFLSMRQGTES